MHQNKYLYKASSYLKRSLVTGIALMGLITISGAAHQAGHASTVYSYHQSRQVGSNDLIHGHHLHLPHAKAAVAMDARTGQILYRKNDNQRRLVASTGKLMDLYLVGRKINNTRHAWYKRVHINHGLRRMSYNGEDGGYHFVPGHHYTVGNLMKASIIASSNNSAIALGKWVGHSNQNFLRMENKQARLWHLKAHFVSASGLENSDLIPWGYGYRNHGANYGNKISAKDLAVIAYHIIHDYPKFLKYSRVTNMHEDSQNLHNYNEFLRHNEYYQKSLHVDGLKTGWTPPAGYCFVGTAKWPHRDRIITVVLHDNNEWSDSKRLIRYVYKHSKLLRRK